MNLKERANIPGDLKNISFLDELERWMNYNKISKEDICLSGSAILAYYGIRENNDLEIIVRETVKEKIKVKGFKDIHIWGHVPISKNIDIFKNQYAVVGYSDSYIFDNECYIKINDFQIVNIQLEYLYKKFLMRYLKKRKKDKQDLEDINRGILNNRKIKQSIFKDKGIGLYYSLLGINIYILRIKSKKLINKIRIYIATIWYYIKRIRGV